MASLMLRLGSIQFAWTHCICMWVIALVGGGNRFGKTGRSLQGKTSFNRLRQYFLSLFSSWWTIYCLVTERPKHWLGYSNKVGELNKFGKSDGHFKIVQATRMQDRHPLFTVSWGGIGIESIEGTYIGMVLYRWNTIPLYKKDRYWSGTIRFRYLSIVRSCKNHRSLVYPDMIYYLSAS